MQEIKQKELKQIRGGGFGTFLLISAGIIFLVGIVDGYVRPLACRS